VLVLAFLLGMLKIPSENELCSLLYFVNSESASVPFKIHAGLFISKWLIYFKMLFIH